MPNRLQYEQSPYLLQHANNPVDWFPWGREAFDKAATENKPLLISIGYAACHWCHVMEHESFEDAAVAAYMNQHFVCIKVDREEHPDVDHLYMDALQAMTNQGGWPLNMFATPDKKPFYGGTYFPPRSVYGRASWLEVLRAIHQLWQEQREDVLLQANQMLQHLQQNSLAGLDAHRDKQVTDEDVVATIANLLATADREDGGFGGAPKFPPTGALQLLMEFSQLYPKHPLAAEALSHALFTLDKMMAGGIYDQVGGGFARYATDKKWFIPHFEKMLYDNALMVSVLSAAFRISRKETYAACIKQTIGFCVREMQLSHGGFYCALDADSEGVEGKYYTWTYEEWQNTAKDFHPAVAGWLGILPEGNWEHTNILSLVFSDGEIAASHNLGLAEWQSMKQQALLALLQQRNKRIRPATDDKILLAWNALMLQALCDAYVAIQEKNYLHIATRLADWLWHNFYSEAEGLLHTYKNGQAQIAAKLDDYAYFIKALWQLFSITGKEEQALRALTLLREADDLFLAEDKTFYYFSSTKQADILVRKIDLYDGATPSANAIMMENLWALGHLFEKPGWPEQAEAMLLSQKKVAMRYPSSFARWAVQQQRYARTLYQLIIAARNAVALCLDWHNGGLYPHVSVFCMDKDQPRVAAMQHKFLEGQTMYYLCREGSCRLPANSAECVKGQLGS
ncbi:MAG: thioredoxin domain-containing protein [Edaphocola sp.]